MELLQEKLIRLASESEKELREIGLGDKLKKDITYKINYRAKSRFGQCCSKKDINISSWLLEIGEDKDIKNTIIHEILHTFEDTKGHNSKWQYYAMYVNNRTNYNISRCGSINEIYRKADIKRPTKKINLKWEITCDKCGMVWKQQKMADKVLKGFKNGTRIHRKCGCKSFTIRNLENGEII